MFSLESPHRGETPYIIPNLQLYRLFSKGLKNEFETAVVNEPSMFETLKFYCISYCSGTKTSGVVG